ncbi:ubiquitin carboxyl-terminal hydrolase-domain-containing protein [Catenaria anguillulae PL171]|uniref:Ubiquitin carboxyl-terminal hydrolase-domain-containing protein n=1 Tax=Catenaria anguillulae PL171 TaxID=765915 RepID=A0A1Y2HP13_9FUNG|nr:ubiquitin carboxyl-terminal hydrolase-domain-containing protein [Catenaria anguillulae PL171]
MDETAADDPSTLLGPASDPGTPPPYLPLETYHVASPVAPSGVTAVRFDPQQELVHCGFQSGHVRSFALPNCSPYTANVASYSPILDLCPDPRADQGSIVLSPDAVKHVHRRGRVLWSLTAKSDMSSAGLLAMTPLQHTPTSTFSTLILSATFSRLHVINVDRGAIVRELVTSDSPPCDYHHLRSPAPHTLLTGSALGALKWIDTRTWKATQSVAVHTGAPGPFAGVACVGDSGTYVATTGVHTGRQVVDVVDVRMGKVLGKVAVGASVMTAAKDGDCVLAVSEAGVLSVVDVGKLQVSATVRVWEDEAGEDAMAAPFACMDVSPSGELLVLGDLAGNTHFWCPPRSDGPVMIPDEYKGGTGHTWNWYPEHELKVNTDSHPIEVPSMVHAAPYVPWSEDVSFNAHVGMPRYTKDTLMSGTWPADLMHSVGLPPATIPATILANARGTPQLRTAPKPASLARNTWPYKTKTEIPKFKSTRRLRSRSRSSSRTRSSTPGTSSSLRPAQTESVLEDYKLMEIQYSRFGVHDFDFHFFNQSPYIGLEPGLPNAYVNNYLQVLFFSPSFRAQAMRHALQPACQKPLCLLCETGYLFRMLDQARAQAETTPVCRAANWCSAFAHLRETHGLNLLENPAVGFTSVATTMATCARFLLDQFRRDDAAVVGGQHPGPAGAGGVGTVVDEFCIQSRTEATCNSCKTRTSKVVDSFTVDLVYPGHRAGNPDVTFVDVLRASMVSASGGLGGAGSGGKAGGAGADMERIWCAKCKQYRPTMQKRLPVRVPDVLQVNCNVKAEWNADWWCSKDSHFTGIPGSGFMPVRFRLALPEPNAEPVFEALPDDGEAGEDVYTLSAVVFEVTEGGRPHIASHIFGEDNAGKGQWYLFNDFRVRAVPHNQVLQFPRWKIPSLVVYRKSSSAAKLALPTAPRLADLDLDWLLDPHLLLPPGRAPALRDPLHPAEILHPGFLCAIDAEFVSHCEEEAEYSSDGIKRIMRPRILSLARVSIVRGSGPLAGSECVDEYIEQRDPVVDYITAFSGIEPRDLDRNASTRRLVALKSAYRKLRCMVDSGAVFIGHSLEQDFRIINLVVPKRQVIDTSQLYHIPAQQRKLSLKFLAWAVLNEHVQVGNHDSVEDARTALALYNKYCEVQAAGNWKTFLKVCMTWDISTGSSRHPLMCTSP